MILFAAVYNTSEGDASRPRHSRTRKRKAVTIDKPDKRPLRKNTKVQEFSKTMCKGNNIFNDDDD